MHAVYNAVCSVQRCMRYTMLYAAYSDACSIQYCMQRIYQYTLFLGKEGHLYSQDATNPPQSWKNAAVLLYTSALVECTFWRAAIASLQWPSFVKAPPYEDQASANESSILQQREKRCCLLRWFRKKIQRKKLTRDSSQMHESLLHFCLAFCTRQQGKRKG